MSEQAKFVGTWRLVAFEDEQPGGEVNFPYGQNPVGLLFYDASGNMAVQIMNGERQSLPASDFSQVDAEKIKAAVSGFTAFFGKYEVDEARQIIIHHVEGHQLPNSVGKVLPRVYEFSGDQLILKPSANRRVIWERVM
jgi:hypothetical protein